MTQYWKCEAGSQPRTDLHQSGKHFGRAPLHELLIIGEELLNDEYALSPLTSEAHMHDGAQEEGRVIRDL